MHYEIDQSGKIEDTAKDTVLALSNGTQYAVLMRRRTKRRLQEAFRHCGLTKMFIYYLFSVGIFTLLTHPKKRSSIVIDIEYPGKDQLLKGIIEQLLNVSRGPYHDIHFEHIGRHPRVHYAAKDVLTAKKKPDKILSLADIVKMLEMIKKTDGRLRECLAILVDAQPRSSRKQYHKRLRQSRVRRRG